MSDTSLSLYQIEAEMLELFELRESAEADSLPAIDQAIAEYAARSLTKVDNIAAFLRECEARADAYSVEAKRLNALAKQWEERGERLKDATIAAMQFSGKRRVAGRSAELVLRKCGPSVDPDIDMELLPSTLKRQQITLNRFTLDEIVWQLARANAEALMEELMLAMRAGPVTPIKAAIAAEIKLAGAVPGARLITDKERLEVR